MEKNKIYIEKEYKYLGEKPGFELPHGIFNKVVTGCGATTVALEDNNPTILICPRLALLENKTAKYNRKVTRVYWVQLEDFKDTTSLNKYIKETQVPKLLITFDSFKKLKKLLGDTIYKYRIVVDEFHKLLQDASFKAEVSQKLVEDLEDLPYVTFLSATPIVNDYLKYIPYLNSLPYTEAVYEDLEYVKIQPIVTNNPLLLVKKLLIHYKLNKKFILTDNNNKTVESNHIFVFINNVYSITKLIKDLNLQPEEVNILISKSSRTTLRKRLGTSYDIGNIPLEGEEVKPITFCTSAAFDGVDFYCEDSISIAVSQANVGSTLLDVITDLPQIAGRQRLTSNRFYNKIFFIYSEILDLNKILSLEEIDNIIKNKYIRTKSRINSIYMLPKPVQYEEILSLKKQLEQEADEYYITITNTNEVIINDFIALAERDSLLRARDYLTNGIKAKISQRNNISINEDIFINTAKSIDIAFNSSSVANALSKSINETHFKSLIEYMKPYYNKESLQMFEAIGYEKSKALGYNVTRIKEEYSSKEINTEELVTLLETLFKTNNGFLSNQIIKKVINSWYSQSNINKKFTATKILELLPNKVKKSGMRIEDKHINGYRLI